MKMTAKRWHFEKERTLRAEVLKEVIKLDNDSNEVQSGLEASSEAHETHWDIPGLKNISNKSISLFAANKEKGTSSLFLIQTE